MILMALPLLLAITSQPDACLPIQDERIYARDVAAAIPAFASVAADFALGYAPGPGLRRVFKGEALERLARNQGVTVEALPDVCFERAMATIEAGEKVPFPQPEMLKRTLGEPTSSPDAPAFTSTDTRLKSELT